MLKRRNENKYYHNRSSENKTSVAAIRVYVSAAIKTLVGSDRLRFLQQFLLLKQLGAAELWAN